MYTDDTNFTRGDAEANRTVSPPGPPNDLGKYTVTVTDIYDRTDTGERSGGVTYTYQIDDIKDVNRFDIGGDGVHLEDHRTIEVIDNDTNQTIKTIDLEFGDNGKIETRTETGRLENIDGIEIGTYKTVANYDENGKVEITEREWTTFEDGHNHIETKIEHDSRNGIEVTNLIDRTEDYGVNTQIREREYDVDGHHNYQRMTVETVSDPPGEIRSDLYSKETFTDESGKEYVIEITIPGDVLDADAKAEYKETITDRENKTIEVREGHFEGTAIDAINNNFESPVIDNVSVENIYQNDVEANENRSDLTRTVSPPGPPNDLGKYTVTVTDIYDRTDTGERSGGITYTYQIDDIKDANRFDIGGDGVHLEDHRTIEIIDNETNQTIKTIDLEFGDNGKIETRTETGFTNPNYVSLGSYEIASHYNDEGIVDSRETRHFDSEGYVTRIDKSVYNGDNLIRTETFRYTYGEDGPVDYSKRIIEFREDGTEKFSSYESYRSESDGSVDRRVEVAYAEDGRRHEIETFYDEKGDITYQTVKDLDSSGYPISIREAVPFESNYDPESADNVEHVVDEFVDTDGHVHTTESWTDDIDKQTVEQHREDGTLESKTVILYDDEKNPVLEIKTSYSEDGKHVEKTERTDFFEKENGAIEAIKTDTTYDEEDHIDQISIQESDDMSLEHNDVDVPEDEDVEDTPNDTDADESNDIDDDDGDDWGDWRD